MLRVAAIVDDMQAEGPGRRVPNTIEIRLSDGALQVNGSPSADRLIRPRSASASRSRPGPDD
jgi:hypothetical protein